MPYKTKPTLQEKLAPLRERYKTADKDKRKWIMLAVNQIKKEYGVRDKNSLFEETFETARKVFG